MATATTNASSVTNTNTSPNSTAYNKLSILLPYVNKLQSLGYLKQPKTFRDYNITEKDQSHIVPEQLFINRH
jgi:hypothetical protein